MGAIWAPPFGDRPTRLVDISGGGSLLVLFGFAEGAYKHFIFLEASACDIGQPAGL